MINLLKLKMRKYRHICTLVNQNVLLDFGHWMMGLAASPKGIRIGFLLTDIIYDINCDSRAPVLSWYHHTNHELWLLEAFTFICSSESFFSFCNYFCFSILFASVSPSFFFFLNFEHKSFWNDWILETWKRSWWFLFSFYLRFGFWCWWTVENFPCVDIW